MSTNFRWAVLLCKCQNENDNQTVQQFFVQFFTPGLQGAVEYWSDMSFGELDLTNSAVFSWVSLPITTQQALTTRRSDAIAMGIDAHKKANHDLGGFNQILVYIDVPFIGQNVTEGGQQGPGSANGQVLVDRNRMRASFINHEIGHGHGLNHSLDDQGRHYFDPYCIMSAEMYANTNPTFTDQRFGPNGPSLCSPYIFAKGWLPQSNIVRIPGDGKRPNWTTLALNPFGRAVSGQPQAALADFNQPFQASYFIEYHQATGWDRGLAQDAVVVRQYRPDGYSYYLGKIATSVGTGPGGAPLAPDRLYLDKQFDLSIQVHRILSDGQVELTIAPAAAVQILSLRTIARDKLGLNASISTRASILRPGINSLRRSLVQILGN